LVSHARENIEMRKYVKKERYYEKEGENCMMRGFKIYTPHQILLGTSNHGGRDGHIKRI
jgi:hypothetical protein